MPSICWKFHEFLPFLLTPVYRSPSARPNVLTGMAQHQPCNRKQEKREKGFVSPDWRWAEGLPCPSSLQEPAVLWRVLWTVSLTLASALWGLNRAFSFSLPVGLRSEIRSLAFILWPLLVFPLEMELIKELFHLLMFMKHLVLSMHNFGYSYSLVSPFFSLPKL